MSSHLHKALGVDKHIEHLHRGRGRGETSNCGRDDRLANLWGQSGTRRGVKRGRLLSTWIEKMIGLCVVRTMKCRGRLRKSAYEQRRWSLWAL